MDGDIALEYAAVFRAEPVANFDARASVWVIRAEDRALGNHSVLSLFEPSPLEEIGGDGGSLSLRVSCLPKTRKGYARLFRLAETLLFGGPPMVVCLSASEDYVIGSHL